MFSKKNNVSSVNNSDMDTDPLNSGSDSETVKDKVKLVKVDLLEFNKNIVQCWECESTFQMDTPLWGINQMNTKKIQCKTMPPPPQAADGKQISMAASAIALRGVRIFLTAGRHVAERAQAQGAAPPPRPKPKGKKPVVGSKPPQKVFDLLLKTTKFTKAEIEALYNMYRRLVISAQAAAPTTAIGHSPKIDGIDQSTFRDVMHNTFDLVTEEAILERMWMTWERGAAGGEGSLRFESWVKGLSVLLRGNTEERIGYCFKVYDLNNDGFITREEMFLLLRNSLLKQPGDEDPDEGVRELVELVLKKLDVDKDGTVSLDDYRQAVEQEPLLLEAFGQCLPTKRHTTTFLKTLTNKT